MENLLLTLEPSEITSFFYNIIFWIWRISPPLATPLHPTHPNLETSCRIIFTTSRAHHLLSIFVMFTMHVPGCKQFYVIPRVIKELSSLLVLYSPRQLPGLYRCINTTSFLDFSFFKYYNGHVTLAILLRNSIAKSVTYCMQYCASLHASSKQNCP